MVTVLASLLGGCGGGGSGGGSAGDQGSIETKSIVSQGNGMTYPLYIYLPPGSASDRASMPVIYVLDAESRFATAVGLVQGPQARIILVGIGNEANRARDYVPANTCTTTGGGEAVFLEFIRAQVIPFVEANVGGDPTRRALLGHSHGGSFVLYAMFAEAPGAHHFNAYLASDASLPCMLDTAYGWESAYAAKYATLPVRLHFSYSANLIQFYADLIGGRHYGGLTLASQLYGGGHLGMIPAAFSDAIAFAFPAQ